MSKIIAIANQKGGVAKTTTACSLGVGLSNKDRRVLLIDCDPQANLTEAMGYQQPDDIEITLATVIENIVKDVDVFYQEQIDALSILKVQRSELNAQYKMIVEYERNKS